MNDCSNKASGFRQDASELSMYAGRLELALDGAEVGYWDHDLTNDHVIRSRRWAEMLGYAPGEIEDEANAWRNLIHPDDMPAVLQAAADHMAGRIPFFRIEHRMRAKSGEWKWILNWGKIIEHDAQGRPVRATGIHLDITERKRFEAELATIDKLETIGLLAGGIAHDFNNLLMVILGRISLAHADAEPGGSIAQNLEEAEDAVARARQLTNELLTFAKGGAPVTRSSSIGAIARSAAKFALHGSKTVCEFDAPDDLAPAEVDENQMKQAFNNILINADQAMPLGGTIRISCRDVTVEPSTSASLSGGAYVEIRISDKGVGIPPAHLAKIFEPFFSTKPGGTGLGLAVAHSIIKNHGGRITVESACGEGTTFTILLPASKAAATGD